MRQRGKSTMGRSARVYPTLAHWLIGRSHEEVLADMARRGETRADALAAFDRTAERARALLRRSEGPPAPELVAGSFEPCLPDGLAFHEERACAGDGLGDSDGGLRPATLADLFGRRDWGSVVAARVSGGSMEEDHIKDGDVVLVDTRRKPRDGDVVLVHLLGRGQLVKRLRSLGPLRIALQSGDPDAEAIVVDDPSTLTVYGVVVGRAGPV